MPRFRTTLRDSRGKALGLGWLPDPPDFRDYTPDHREVQPVLAMAGAADPKTATPPSSVDLRQWCAPVEDQGQIGSCTANAGVGMLEYFQRRACGEHLEGSRLFLYKATRNLLGWTGDTGAFLRSTIGAMALFGVPPEQHWAYDEARFDEEPPAFCYAFAANFQALKYYRLDPPGSDGATILAEIKTHLAAGLPVMFGFTVYNSIRDASDTGDIPFPSPGEHVEGGHAVVAVGYDDERVITNPAGQETQGAVLIRNSWGRGWGEDGYGHLPFEYVLQQLAVDHWVLIENEWIDTGNFGQ